MARRGGVASDTVLESWLLLGSAAFLFVT